MNNSLIYAVIVVAAQFSALADVYVNRGGCHPGGCCNSTWTRVSYRHVPLSDPKDPFHDTYKRNTGRLNDQAQKPVANAHAKTSAAEKRADSVAARNSDRSGISVYSNISAPKPSVQQTQTTIVQKQINISNSNVTINN